MTEDIKKYLSKCKYVYRIYKKDNTFHIEKYPIVYINSEVVYYKIYYKNGRKESLCSCYFNDQYRNVKESFDKAIEYLNSLPDSYYATSVYFVETNKLKEFDLSLIKKQLRENNVKSKIKTQEETVERAKNQYEAAVKNLEKMKKKFNVESGESDG